MSLPVRLLACTLALLLLSGCGTRDPAIGVAGARLAEVTDEALTLQIALTLDNPNSKPLELLEFRYRVEVDGRTVYSGARAAEMTLEQLSTRTIELPAVVVFNQPATAGWSAQSLPATAAFKVHGSLRYLLPGAIDQTLFDMGVRRPSAPVRGGGSLALQPPPESAS
jgi:LEA14-like dessication related protein